jgi:hypothetical protein
MNKCHFGILSTLCLFPYVVMYNTAPLAVLWMYLVEDGGQSIYSWRHKCCPHQSVLTGQYFTGLLMWGIRLGIHWVCIHWVGIPMYSSVIIRHLGGSGVIQVQFDSCFHWLIDKNVVLKCSIIERPERGVSWYALDSACCYQHSNLSGCFIKCPLHWNIP